MPWPDGVLAGRCRVGIRSVAAGKRAPPAIFLTTLAVSLLLLREVRRTHITPQVIVMPLRDISPGAAAGADARCGQESTRCLT
jgi:hypothetical protein